MTSSEGQDTVAGVESSSPPQAANRPSEGSGMDVLAAHPEEADPSPDTLEGLFMSGAIFGIVPIGLLENRKWSGSAIRVYIALASFQGRNGSCYPSLNQIAERAHIARSGVQKALRWLEQEGEVSVIRNGRRGNKYEVHRITTLLSSTLPPYSGPDNTTIEGKVNTTPVVTKRTVKDQEKNIEKTADQKGRFRQEDFDEFWAAYPRRVGKAAALRKYQSIVRGGTNPKAILQGVRQYVTSVAGKEMQYIAHPTTWLNAGRWDDELNVTSDLPQEIQDRLIRDEDGRFYYRQDDERVYV